MRYQRYQFKEWVSALVIRGVTWVLCFGCGVKREFKEREFFWVRALLRGGCVEGDQDICAGTEEVSLRTGTNFNPPQLGRQERIWTSPRSPAPPTTVANWAPVIAVLPFKVLHAFTELWSLSRKSYLLSSCYICPYLAWDFLYPLNYKAWACFAEPWMFVHVFISEHLRTIEILDLETSVTNAVIPLNFWLQALNPQSINKKESTKTICALF